MWSGTVGILHLLSIVVGLVSLYFVFNAFIADKARNYYQSSRRWRLGAASFLVAYLLLTISKFITK